MISVTAFVALLILTIGAARLLVKGEDWRWVAKLMLVAWCTLFPLVALVDMWFPFSIAGDDADYFRLAARHFNSIADLFDTTQFVGLMEQPGYPWLLSIFFQFTGPDVLALKLLNLALFMMLIPTAYRTGLKLESPAFARVMAVAVFLMAPLWYYSFFLLKDMVVTLLQSLFLMSVVQLSRGARSWLLCLATTLPLLLFRSQLVLVNLAILTGTVLVLAFRRAELRKSIMGVLVPLVMSGVVAGTVLLISSNPDAMAAMGIVGEHRVIGTQASQDLVTTYVQSSDMNMSMFPVLYLFSETSALNVHSWEHFDPVISLRGVCALPWIFIGVPFFFFGFAQLVRVDLPSGGGGGRGLWAAARSIRFVATPWGSVLILILVYVAVSWTVRDTTRWRIPDMPAMAAIAAYGWQKLTPGRRLPVLLLWVAGSAILFMTYYAVMR